MRLVFRKGFLCLGEIKADFHLKELDVRGKDVSDTATPASCSQVYCRIIDIIQRAAACEVSEELCLPQITEVVLEIDCRRGSRERADQRRVVSLGCRSSCRPTMHRPGLFLPFSPRLGRTCLEHRSPDSFLFETVP